MGSPDPIRRNLYLLLGGFWIAALGIVLVGYRYYRDQKTTLENDEHRQLAAIADLKLRQVIFWRRERLIDGQVLAMAATSPAIADVLRGRVQPASRRHAEAWMESVRAAAGYANMVLVSPRSKTWIGVGRGITGPGHFFQLAEEVMRTGRVVLSDFHLDRGLHGPHLGLNIPLRTAPDGPPEGALLVGIDPNSYLYPMIQSWPTASRTAETLLARREGDHVLFLNELRHRRGTALTLRLPAAKADFPAGRGATGFVGLMEGRDYREVPVLAAVRPIPDTSWVLVAKVDLDEVYATVKKQALWLGLIVFTVVLMIGAGVALLIHDVQVRIRRQREEAKVEHRALLGRYEHLSRFANDIILLFDESERVLDANDRALSAYGYTRDELIGMNARQLRDPASRADIDAHWQRLRENDHVIYETRHQRRDGGTFPVEVSGRRTFVEGMVLAQTIIRDITERKDAEKERERLQEQLRQSQKLESIGRLAGGIAHDFNNLLTIINGYSAMLLGALPEGDELRDSAQQILEAGERAAGLTRQLLAFSRKQVICPQRVDLNAVILELAKMLERLVGEDIAVIPDLEPTLAPVLVDPGQMEQVLMNLATNARDAMREGGKLCIQTRHAQIRETDEAALTGMAAGSYVLLTISDTGTGMNADTLEHVFEPFFTTKPRGQGTGLGLSTVYGIIRQSNGWIGAESQVGRGTTFRIYLPIAAASAPAAGDELHIPATGPLHGTETVLVVEDQAEVRRLTADIIRQFGYRVLEAESADAALTLSSIFTGTIHLILTDVVLPDANGRVLAEQLKTARPAAKVLYMSGYTEDFIAHKGILEPGIAYLPKPFTPVGLLQKVREVLGEPHSGRETDTGFPGNRAAGADGGS